MRVDARRDLVHVVFGESEGALNLPHRRAERLHLGKLRLGTLLPAGKLHVTGQRRTPLRIALDAPPFLQKKPLDGVLD